MLSPILLSSFLLKTYTESSGLVKAEGAPGGLLAGKARLWKKNKRALVKMGLGFVSHGSGAAVN